MHRIYYHKFLEKFISSLEKSATAKFLRTLDLLEEFGLKLGMPHSKKVADKIFELRIRGAQEVRILYTFKENSIILIHGFIKKSRKSPKRGIETAKNKIKNITLE